MATLNCFFHLIMAFMLHSSLLFSYFPEKSAALDTPECLSYFTDLKERPQSTLELFHRDGPCSPAAGHGPMNMPSPQDILHRDRLRVQSLQSRFESKTNKYDSLSQDTKQVVNVIEGEYATSISLGTPEQKLTHVLDTGSDLTWTRCSRDLSIEGLEFKYSNSTSFSSIPCYSSDCIDLPLGIKHTCDTFNGTKNTCLYGVEYGDGSYTEGFLSMDNLIITQTGDVFTKWKFGCATQTDFRGGGFIFCYCLPSNSSVTGFLKLGKRDYLNVPFTPLITNSDYPSYYFINITSIIVGTIPLPC